MEEMSLTRTLLLRLSTGPYCNTTRYNAAGTSVGGIYQMGKQEIWSTGKYREIKPIKGLATSATFPAQWRPRAGDRAAAATAPVKGDWNTILYKWLSCMCWTLQQLNGEVHRSAVY